MGPGRRPTSIAHLGSTIRLLPLVRTKHEAAAIHLFRRRRGNGPLECGRPPLSCPPSLVRAVGDPSAKDHARRVRSLAFGGDKWANLAWFSKDHVGAVAHPSSWTSCLLRCLQSAAGRSLR